MRRDIRDQMNRICYALLLVVGTAASLAAHEDGELRLLPPVRSTEVDVNPSGDRTGDATVEDAVLGDVVTEDGNPVDTAPPPSVGSRDVIEPVRDAQGPQTSPAGSIESPPIETARAITRSVPVASSEFPAFEMPPPSSPFVDTVPDELFAPTPALGPEEWSWTRPSTWFVHPLWKFGAELGLNGSAGNAQAFSLLAATNAKRENEFNALEWDIKYGKSQTGGVETQHYALLNTRWDWKFGPQWLIYNKNLLEYNEFKAFDMRLMLSGGLGFNVIKDDITTWTLRFGAGASREFGGPEDRWIPEANLGTDYERQLNNRQKLKFSTDYYPSWEDLSDYRLVTNAHWEILLDEATNLSLKIGAVDLYDSTPNGRLANDINYFVTLLWKR